MKRKSWQTLAVTSFLYFASAAPGYAEELPLPTSVEDVATAIQDIASTVAAVPEAPPLPTVVADGADTYDGRPRTNPVDVTNGHGKPVSAAYNAVSAVERRCREHAGGACVDCLGRDTGYHAGDHGRRAAGGPGDRRYL